MSERIPYRRMNAKGRFLLWKLAQAVFDDRNKGAKEFREEWLRLSTFKGFLEKEEVMDEAAKMLDIIVEDLVDANPINSI